MKGGFGVQWQGTLRQSTVLAKPMRCISVIFGWIVLQHQWPLQHHHTGLAESTHGHGEVVLAHHGAAEAPLHDSTKLVFPE